MLRFFIFVRFNDFYLLLFYVRFLLDLDIAAPKITIPTDFCPDNGHPTKLMLDLGNLVIGTKVGNKVCSYI